MKLWEARFGMVLMVGAETREEAERKVAEFAKGKGAMKYGQWLLKEKK